MFLQLQSYLVLKYCKSTFKSELPEVETRMYNWRRITEDKTQDHTSTYYRIEDVYTCMYISYIYDGAVFLMLCSLKYKSN